MDPKQNINFLDHILDVTIDLSKVINMMSDQLMDTTLFHVILFN